MGTAVGGVGMTSVPVLLSILYFVYVPIKYVPDSS